MQIPGRPTRAGARALSLLRDAGVPYLAHADEATLRALALGLRAALRRTIARPLAAPSGALQVTFAPLGADDVVTLLPDNAEAFDARCALVDGASRTLDCALYYLADDATGARFAGALARAATRGVRVRLAVDTYASQEKQFGPFGFHAADRGALVLLDRLRAAGVDVREVGSDRFCMHRKFLIADGAQLLFGGRNVADHYASPGWRDLELSVRGPVVESLAPVVNATFDDATKPVAASPGVVPGVPGRRGRAYARAFETLVARARRSVDIEHAYVLEHDWLVSALRDAVRRGVRVRLLTNSAESNDLPFMNWRAAVTLEALLAAGVEIYRRTGSGATLHTKLVVGDRRTVLFGSTNLDYYSPIYGAELDLALESESLGDALVTTIELGLAEPTTKAIPCGGVERALLERERRGWSVSRAFDLLLHDIQ